jgi:hypothetical protein
MGYLIDYVKDDSGIALLNGLVIMALLTALGTYAINMTQIERSLSANLKASKQAFYVAEAGVEWGRRQIATSTAIPPQPADATQSLNLGGYYAGDYFVKFSNPMPAEPAWQYTIPIQVTGNIGTASKTLQALVTKTYDLSDGAIAMRGNEADSDFGNGHAILVDGRDYRLSDGTYSLTSAPEQLGISVPTTALEAVVEGKLNSKQRDRIKGLDGTSSNPSVAVSQSLSSSTITSLANALCPSTLPTRYTLETHQKLTYTGTTTFGNRTTPEVHCFDGLGTPGTMELELKGNASGVGVLIVRNADLVTRGNFKFEGLIIVTGSKVGFGMIGGGQQDVYGSVMINETDFDGPTHRELVLEGNASVKRSQSALAMAKALIPASTMSSIIGGLRSSALQVSWSEVSD